MPTLVYLVEVGEYHPLRNLPLPEPGEKAEVIDPHRHYYAAEYVGVADDELIAKIRKNIK